MRKHLYRYMHKPGRRWEHADLCWCKQLGRDCSIVNEVYSDDYEMKYPHEASDPYCRCDEPVADIEEFNDIHFAVCRICGKTMR